MVVLKRMKIRKIEDFKKYAKNELGKKVIIYNEEYYVNFNGNKKKLVLNLKNKENNDEFNVMILKENFEIKRIEDSSGTYHIIFEKDSIILRKYDFLSLYEEAKIDFFEIDYLFEKGKNFKENCEKFFKNFNFKLIRKINNF